MSSRYLIAAAALLLTASLASAQARQRWPSDAPEGGQAAPRTAVPRNDPPRESPPPPPPPRPATAAPDPTPRPAAAPPATRSTAAPPEEQGRAQPRGSRPRGDNPRTGTAVPRASAPPPLATRSRPPTTVYRNNYYYPRYPSRYYPYGYGSFGLGYFYYDPYSWDPYDNWRFNGYGYGSPTGELRLQVRPRHAEVFVDGYYAGVVDDFDGVVQGLRLEEGPYSIEVVAPGYEPIEFDVRIQPGRKITYRGELRPQP